MKDLLGNLRMDLRRAFLSPSFLLAVTGMCAALLASASTEEGVLVSGMADVLYVYGVAHVQGFVILALIFATLPYATSFCTDWNHQFIRAAVIRTNLTSYGISKVLSCALAGGTAVALGEVLFILLLCLRLPVVNAQGYTIGMTSSLYGSLLAGGHFVAYFAASILIEFAAAAVFAILALWISTYLTNVFVTLASPLLAYYFLINSSHRIGLPPWLEPYAIFSGTCLAKPVFSLLYTIFWCAFLCVLLGMMIVWQIERRQQNG